MKPLTLHRLRQLDTFLNKLQEDHLTAYSAMASFFLITSAIPFLMLVLMSARFLPFSADDVLNILNSFAIIHDNSLFQIIIEEVFAQTDSMIMGLTILTLFWAASKGVWGFIKGLNSVYDVEETRNMVLLRIAAVFYTFVFLLLLISALILLVFGSSIYHNILIQYAFLARFAGLFILLKNVFAIFVLTGFFVLFYKHLPDRKSAWKSELPGAIAASLGWSVFSYFFSLYVTYSTSYANLYGSLGIVLMFFLWLYTIMYILFLGAEINFFLSPQGKKRMGIYY